MKLSKPAPKDKNKKPTTDKKSAGLSFGKKKVDEVEDIDPDTFVYETTLPRVNVIPSHITEKYEVNGLMKKAGVALIGVVGAIALVAGGSMGYQGIMNAQINTLIEQKMQLETQAAELAPYLEYKTKVEEKRKTLSSAVNADVNMGVIYGDIYETALPDQITLADVSITQNEKTDINQQVDTGAACMNPDPYITNDTIIGCIMMQGAAPSLSNVKNYIANLVAITPSKYANPFISSITTSEDQEATTGRVNFEAAISFTDELYTDQYNTLQLTIEQILAGDTNAPSMRTSNTPVEQAPAEEVPAEQIPVEQAPAEEPPVVSEEVIVEETPTTEEETVEEVEVENTNSLFTQIEKVFGKLFADKGGK